MKRLLSWLLLSAAACAQSVSNTTFGPTVVNASNPGYYLVTFTVIPGTSSGNLRILQAFAGNVFSYSMPPGLPSYNCAANLRDPSIVKSGVSGSTLYYLAHTGNCSAVASGISLSSSSDGLTWANATTYDCNATVSGGSLHCWAPEWFADPNASGLASLHLFFSSSPNSGCCGGFQIYEMHPTASDFITNTASWSTPVHITVTSETAIVDSFVVYRGDTSTYYLWYAQKNNTGTGSGTCIGYASSSTLTGTYTDVSANNCYGINGGAYVEAPLLIQTVAGSPGTWVLCGDPFNNTYEQGQLTCLTSTDGWSTWQMVGELITPTQAKHGTIIPYP